MLGEGQEAFIVVQSCDSNSTFKVVGSKAIFVGLGDKYDGEFRNLGVTGEFVNGTDTDGEMAGFKHKVHVFPSESMKREFITPKPLICSAVIVSVYFFSGLVFILYDFFVTNRQKHTEKKAETSSAIVQELFPGDVAVKLYSTPTGLLPGGTRSMSDSGSLSTAKTSIADFYPATTIMFADIAGEYVDSRSGSATVISNPFFYVRVYSVELYPPSSASLYAIGSYFPGMLFVLCSHLDNWIDRLTIGHFI